jgi:NAD(P)-dependent dehydrogenase (short-subunit alcohol dehydrogenase family)
MEDLRGKVAVVTGGAGGIGQAMGRRFGQAGMKVVLADVLGQTQGKATRAIADEGREATWVPTDVTDYTTVE